MSKELVRTEKQEVQPSVSAMLEQAVGVAAESGLWAEVVREDPRLMELVSGVQSAQWQTQENFEHAAASVDGFFHAAINGFEKQAKLHLGELHDVYGLNSAQAVVDLLRDKDAGVKIFARKRNPTKSFDIRGKKHNWRINSIDLSDEVVPASFLSRLTELRAAGFSPSGVYVGVPYVPQERSSSQQTGSYRRAFPSDNQEYRTVVQRSPMFLDDPLLLAAFGKDVITLVELARWE